MHRRISPNTTFVYNEIAEAAGVDTIESMDDLR